MKWFKHFSNAHDDNAMRKVRMKYGADGYAVYWYCIELIAGDLEGENATFELSHDAEVIGYDLKIDQLRVEEIMRYMVDLNLFELSNEKITCLKIAKFLDKKMTRNSDILAIIDKFNETKNVADNLGQSPDSPQHSRLEEKRKEETRNNTSSSQQTNKTSIPKDFKISDSVRKWANEKSFKNLEAHLENFIIQCQSKNYKYANWDSAFMSAIRNDWAGVNSQPVKKEEKWG